MLKKENLFLLQMVPIFVLILQHLFIVSGCLHSRFWENGHAKEIPMTMGMQSTGANSITIYPRQQMDHDCRQDHFS